MKKEPLLRLAALPSQLPKGSYDVHLWNSKRVS